MKWIGEIKSDLKLAKIIQIYKKDPNWINGKFTKKKMKENKTRRKEGREGMKEVWAQRKANKCLYVLCVDANRLIWNG